MTFEEKFDTDSSFFSIIDGSHGESVAGEIRGNQIWCQLWQETLNSMSKLEIFILLSVVYIPV